jgi:Domain of unknown function (DUF4192)
MADQLCFHAPASTRTRNRELPAFLGFAPTNSIVAYMLHRDANTADMLVRVAIRFDVSITVDQAANFPATCNLRPDTNHAAVLLAVCDQPHDWHAGTVLDTLRDAMAGAGIPVLRRIMTHDVTAQGHWYDPDTGEVGPTYPYTDSLITAQRVLAGDRVSHHRSDIENEFAPLPPAPPSPSAITASSWSAPPKKSPTPSKGTRSTARYPPAPASPSPPTRVCATP